MNEFDKQEAHRFQMNSHLKPEFQCKVRKINIYKPSEDEEGNFNCFGDGAELPEDALGTNWQKEVEYIDDLAKELRNSEPLMSNTVRYVADILDSRETEPLSCTIAALKGLLLACDEDETVVTYLLQRIIDILEGLQRGANNVC